MLSFNGTGASSIPNDLAAALAVSVCVNLGRQTSVYASTTWCVPRTLDVLETQPDFHSQNESSERPN